MTGTGPIAAQLPPGPGNPRRTKKNRLTKGGDLEETFGFADYRHHYAGMRMRCVLPALFAPRNPWRTKARPLAGAQP
ncbi:hypothetical protein BN2476_110002 [Paraburkholderia piptadeniae]|uniref:Uncharacterized protein n=1 Tax=Paraburkholderia piptadeniae TaxID=1701573 RepID=A0A1N7RQE3_9BURK|nr:hypothetical protein BN2476_110002 [Paraburkholderia piptadeniae]